MPCGEETTRSGNVPRESTATQNSSFSGQTVNSDFNPMHHSSVNSEVAQTITASLENEAHRVDFSHSLHKACLKQWLEDNSTCPVCQAEVTPSIFQGRLNQDWRKAGYCDMIVEDVEGESD